MEKIINNKLLEQTLEYYKSPICTFQLPYDTAMRQYRVRTPSGLFKKILKRIRNEDDLKEAVIKERAIDIYRTISTYLNPSKIGHKPSKNDKNWADHILLNNRLLLDFDAKEQSYYGLNVARQLALAAHLKILQEKVYQLEDIIFTTRGFHLVYLDLGLGLPKEIKNRLEYVEGRRIELICRLFLGLDKDSIIKFLNNHRLVYTKDSPFKQLPFDYMVTINSTQISRCIGSVNSKTGLVCSKINEDMLSTPVEDWMYNIPYITKERPVMPTRIIGSIKMKDGQMISFPSCNIDEGVTESGPRSPFIFKKYITTQVVGTKDRFVLYLKYNKGYETVINELKNLVSKYKMSNVYMYKNANTFHALCLQTIPKPRILKIYNVTNSVNKNKMIKFGRDYILWPEEYTLVGTIPGYTDKLCSEPHATFLYYLGFDVNEKNFHGDGYQIIKSREIAGKK